MSERLSYVWAACGLRVGCVVGQIKRGNIWSDTPNVLFQVISLIDTADYFIPKNSTLDVIQP